MKITYINFSNFVPILLKFLEGMNSLVYDNLGATASTIAPKSPPSTIISVDLSPRLSHSFLIYLIKHLIPFLMCHINPSLSSIRSNILILEKYSISPNSIASNIIVAGYSVTFSVSIPNTSIFSISLVSATCLVAVAYSDAIRNILLRANLYILTRLTFSFFPSIILTIFSFLFNTHKSLKSSKSNTCKTKRPLYSQVLYKGLFLRYLLYFILSRSLVALGRMRGVALKYLQ